MKTFVTLLKREFWEHRGGFLWAPLVVVGFFVLFTLVGLIFGEIHANGSKFKIMNVQLSQIVDGMPAETMLKVGNGIDAGLATMSLTVQMVLGIVLFFYLIGTLFDDRKDRSILFWKSLPVSDIQTVGSKIFTAAFVAPVIAWAAGIVFHVLMLGIIALFLSLHGVNAFSLLFSGGMSEHVHPFRMWASMLAAIPVNALWAVPTYGWLLLVSAWARGKPFIWAVAVPLVAGALASWLDMLTNLRLPETWMWTHVIPRGMASVLPFSWGSGGSGFGYSFSMDRTPADQISFTSLGNVLASPNLWIGVAIGAAMIAGAVYLRRYREIAD